MLYPQELDQLALLVLVVKGPRQNCAGVFIGFQGLDDCCRQVCYRVDPVRE